MLLNFTLFLLSPRPYRYLLRSPCDTRIHRPYPTYPPSDLRVLSDFNHIRPLRLFLASRSDVPVLLLLNYTYFKPPPLLTCFPQLNSSHPASHNTTQTDRPTSLCSPTYHPHSLTCPPLCPVDFAIVYPAFRITLATPHATLTSRACPKKYHFNITSPARFTAPSTF